MAKRFRFSLKMLFAAVTACAVPIAWISWNLHVVHTRNNLLLWMEQHGVGYTAAGDLIQNGMSDLNNGGYETEMNENELHPIPWIRRQLGDRSVRWIVTSDFPKDHSGKISDLQAWFPEAVFVDEGVPIAHFRTITEPKGRIRQPTFKWVDAIDPADSHRERISN